MGNNAWTGAMPPNDCTGLECGAMAQRRDLFCRSTALALPLVMLGVALLAGAIFVSNQVVSCRLKVARLEDRREYMEAKAAHLQARWNSLTTAESIQTRARREIGLIIPDQPQLVLVQTVIPQNGRPGIWDRILSRFDGVAPLEAATVPWSAPGEKDMVFLEPAVSRDGPR